MSLSLSRDTKLFVSTVTSGFDDTNTWEILIGEDFSYSQSQTTSDITADEAGPAPIRGSSRYNNSLDPVDWNFTTYIRPNVDSTLAIHSVVDKIMWHALVSGNAVDFTTGAVYGDAAPGLAGDAFHVGLAERNVHELTKLQLYFVTGDKTYYIKDAQVGSASISLSIEDIAMTAWSGQGTELIGMLEGVDAPDFSSVAAPDYTADYIKNKLTVMDFIADYTGGGDKNYDIAITGGEITISNNITYLTPSTLSIVDKPIGSFTGSLDVSGNFTCYVNNKVGGLGSYDLWVDLLSATDQTQTEALVTFYVGGKATPLAVFTFPQAMVSIPAVQSEDIISSSVEFKALPTALDATDEATLKFLNSSLPYA